ncbi:MAG: ribonuclease Z [bacterium]|nr:ribonuclease Z [bacterium]
MDGISLLLDIGPGALVRLVRSGDAPGGVDDIHTVLLTHLHPDHTGDLVALLFALHSPLPASDAPLRLFGPPGLQRLLGQLGAIYGSWLVPRKRALEVTEVQPGDELPIGDGGALARPFAVDHPRTACRNCNWAGASPMRRAAAWSSPATPATARPCARPPGTATCCSSNARPPTNGTCPGT